jgi:hypothetical protein
MSLITTYDFFNNIDKRYHPFVFIVENECFYRNVNDVSDIIYDTSVSNDHNIDILYFYDNHDYRKYFTFSHTVRNVYVFYNMIKNLVKENKIVYLLQDSFNVVLHQDDNLDCNDVRRCSFSVSSLKNKSTERYIRKIKIETIFDDVRNK